MPEQDCLQIAESIDHYRAKCRENSLNSAARANDIYQLDTLNRHESHFLQETVNSLPLLDFCELAVLDSTADNGLPHTRPPRVICIPKSIIKAQPASASFRTTLIHEAIHVHQRLFTEEWDTACRSAGWTPVDKKHIPAEFIDRCRLNPDTLQSPFWAWQGTTVPLPLFRNRYSPSIELSDVSIQWLDLRMGTLFHTAPPTFQAKYGSHTIHQPEHPYEIYAELFSQIPVKTSTDIFQNLQTI